MTIQPGGALRQEALFDRRASLPGLWDGWSMEATLPRAAEIWALRDYLHPGTRLYLSALPRMAPKSQIAAAGIVRRAGFDPVPHVAARQFRDRTDLKCYLEAMLGDAGITRLLLIAGDLPRPRGPYADTMDVLRDETLLKTGIREIGISGYPEGHPAVAQDRLDAYLAAKAARIAEAGIGLEIVSQFCFDAKAIARWYRRLRQNGITAPARIGLAGPASAQTLLKFALRCGVALPLNQAKSALQLFRGVSADDTLRGLLDGPVDTGEARFHFYSFGGIRRTAQWAHLAEKAFTGK